MNFWEELGKVGVGKCNLSPRCGKNVTGQVKTTVGLFLISAQKIQQWVCSVLTLAWQDSQGSSKDSCCADVLPYILECGDLNGELTKNRKKNQIWVTAVFACRLSSVHVVCLIDICVDSWTCYRWWLVLMDAVQWVRLHHHPKSPTLGRCLLHSRRRWARARLCSVAPFAQCQRRENRSLVGCIYLGRNQWGYWVRRFRSQQDLGSLLKMLVPVLMQCRALLPSRAVRMLWTFFLVRAVAVPVSLWRR